ncbi:SPOCS domain-containing protein [Clostridium sp.]|uniref:SPOCS domain-containing protein n=1 Tax=Clostridium sp. TaxID=1506 RepID=UPI001A363373|nr:SPOCS domain-containing protein [Clostridium sp.]MBK5237094.1 DUF3794 domain-containing protein [Clostridium sp.]
MNRNSIDVEGITPEHKLLEKSLGMLMQYSEVDYIFIPNYNPDISNLIKINLQIEIKHKKNIKSALGETIILDGIKKYKIFYVTDESIEKVVAINVNSPFNTFFTIPDDQVCKNNLELHLVDAFFQLIDKKKIYSHILYMVNVETNSKKQPSLNLEYNDNFRTLETNYNNMGYVNLMNEELANLLLLEAKVVVVEDI